MRATCAVAAVALLLTMQFFGSMQTQVGADKTLSTEVVHASRHHNPCKTQELHCIATSSNNGGRMRCAEAALLMQSTPGLLRLRGAGGGPASISGKRRREPAAHVDDSDEDPGGIPRQWWGEPPKRARMEGLVSTALSASYTLATLPLSIAYSVCAAGKNSQQFSVLIILLGIDNNAVVGEFLAVVFAPLTGPGPPGPPR